MNELDILQELRRKVGREFNYELEGEHVVSLRLSSDDYILGG